jgi:hypothetical protein
MAAAVGRAVCLAGPSPGAVRGACASAGETTASASAAPAAPNLLFTRMLLEGGVIQAIGN